MKKSSYLPGPVVDVPLSENHVHSYSPILVPSAPTGFSSIVELTNTEIMVEVARQTPCLPIYLAYAQAMKAADSS